jgi:outer membrane protein assembly factor BamB
MPDNPRAADNEQLQQHTDRPGRARHRWFPILVAAIAAAWWARRWYYADYVTIYHYAVVGVAGLLIGGWFVRCGSGARKKRLAFVGAICLALIALFVVFRPVYNGDMGIFSWRLRFAPRADQQMSPLQSAGIADDWHATPSDYPRFLGNGYWAEVHGAKLETDWKQNAPQQIWRREIGAGWSAFSIVGNHAVTQEQRGAQELVSCYSLDTGEPVWIHADNTRFDPTDVAGSLGDIGPRATPTIVGDKIFTQGGTGIVNCLDARTGKVIWSHDTAKQFNAPIALWGKSGSPIVVDDTIVISVGASSDPANSAPHGSSLVAFDMETGDVRWTAGTREASYATPILTSIAGERQVVVVNQSWVTAHRASDGKVLWEHPWANENDREASCSQPVPLDHNLLFLSKGYGTGSSLLRVNRNSASEFSVEPLWQPAIKRIMKTKFSNVVVRGDFIYGLDDVLLSCIEWKTGEVRWKKRRTPEFGHGQVMLVGDVIVVLSETGELALVAATPEEYQELASLQVLSEANVTWNNPAFAPPFLLVRNSREAACYRLPLQ